MPDNMQDQKIENQLNLALSVSESVRAQSSELNSGYDTEDKTWEVVVRYNGDFEKLREQYNIQITYLLAGYAILQVPEQYINTIARTPVIEYMEKPKPLYFASEAARNNSCFNLKPILPYDLTGEGTIVAVIDSGVDYAHPAFRNPDGTTRILYMWDQSEGWIEPIDKLETEFGDEPGKGFGEPPKGYGFGVEYNTEILNYALTLPPLERRRIVPETDTSGHGTHVLGIAAGNIDPVNDTSGCAPESDIIVVKLGSRRTAPSSLSGTTDALTTDLMLAINYVIEKAISLEKPVAINLSFGNSYGDHNGTSLLETYINDVYGVWKLAIVAGTGNEGSADRHVSGVLSDKTETVDLLVYGFTQSFDIQIWKDYSDDIAFEIISPDEKSTGLITGNSTISKYYLYNTDIYVYFGEPKPYSTAQEIYIELLPSEGFFDEGLWKIRLIPLAIRNGRYYMWLPAGRTLDNGSGFLESVSDVTLTIPSTAARVISVGAYNSDTDQIAFFSGRGYTTGGMVKPEIVAPGVNIYSAAPGGGYTIKSGTSMAAPFVTGAASCLMQWGIVMGNDPYLYGDKIKAYLIKGARRLPGFTSWPNRAAGWGALCLRNSLPGR